MLTGTGILPILEMEFVLTELTVDVDKVFELTLMVKEEKEEFANVLLCPYRILRIPQNQA